jgi:glycerol-3-phosphate dehydrogenase
VKVGQRVVGVKAHDLETDEHFEILAKQVVNATGVWTDETQAMVGERGQFKVRASKGIHLVVPRDRFQSKLGLLLRTEKSVLFVIPWGRHWLIGTTDTDWHLDLAHPAATRGDIDYILEHTNKVLVTPLTHDDIEGVYAGLRPLLAGESEQTSKLSREHAVARVAPGLVAIAGGKYTTYRVMAADAVDAAAVDIPRRVAPSITDKVPLIGADGYHALVNQAEQIAARYGLHPHRVTHLLNRYGSLLHQVLALTDDRRELLAPIPGSPDYLQVEVVYAASHEGALHLDDVLARRTRISIEYAHRGVESAQSVAELMASVLGWDGDTVKREVEIYTARVEAERASQAQEDDDAADKARIAAPEARPGLVGHVSPAPTH